MNAFVLAGGKSTRMGRDKSMLEFGGRPLIEHAVERLCKTGLSVRIVGSRSDLAVFADVIPDKRRHMGPLGGIEAALLTSDSEQNLFLSVDSPWVPIDFLRWMVERAEMTSALATIPRVLGRPQPLIAMYSKSLLSYVQVSLDVGDAKVMHAIERAANALGLPIDNFDVEPIATAQSWERSFPLRKWFENINTPEEFAKASLEQSGCLH